MEVGVVSDISLTIEGLSVQWTPPRIFVLVIKFYRNIEHLHFGISILNYLFFLFRLFLLGRFVFSICRDWDEDESEKALEQVEIECSYQFRHRIIKKENIFSLFKFDILANIKTTSSP